MPLKPLPTDLEILNEVYETYYDEFATQPTDSRSAWIPIDIERIANKLSIDVDVVFGRLHFYLEHKFKKRDEGTSLFQLNVGEKKNCINFPLMSSILAELRKEDERHWWAWALSIASAIIAGLSLALSIVSLLITTNRPG